MPTASFYRAYPLPLPATSVNINNLKTVTVNQNATGTATATNQVTIGANLNATQSILLGAPVVGTMSSTNGTTGGVNNSVTGSDILVGSDLGGPGVHIARGDTMTITSGSNAPITFTYGGFGISRNITSNINGVSTAGNGDGTKTLDTETIAGANITNAGGGSNVITVTVPLATVGDYSVGGHISLTGASSIGSIPAANINGEHTITGINLATGAITFTQATNNAGAAGSSATAASIANRTNPFTGNILNATTTTADFLNSGTNPLQISSFTSTALKFSITSGGAAYNFSYSTAPSATASTFNSLQTLSDAINAQSGITARVVNGRLYVSSTDATQSVTFANGDALGNGGLSGIDWVQNLIWLL